MKSIVLILSLTFSAGVISSCGKFGNKMEIVKDCTGIYLQKDNVDYKVCNEEILDGYSAGDKIKVEYDLLSECFGLIGEPVCMLFHPYESNIEITKIK